MYYRRAFVPGATCFFTVAAARRRPAFRDAVARALLRQAFRHVAQKHPFTVDAMVVLPDHLHCLWTLPPMDTDYPMRWRLIKTWVTQRYGDGSPRPVKRPIWQGRYWEHLIRDEKDYRQHVEYTHYNPVKHGYVRTPVAWPHSSFRRYVKEGVYTEEWGSTEPSWDGEVGRE